MLKKLEEWIMIVVLAVMSVMAFYQVVTRYVLTSIALTWTEELVRYLFVVVTFLGAAMVLRRRGHAGIEMLSRMLPARMQPYQRVYADLCGLAFSVVATYVCIELVFKQRTLGLLTPGTRVPMYWVSLPMVAGFGLMAWYSLRDLVGVVRSFTGRKQETT